MYGKEPRYNEPIPGSTVDILYKRYGHILCKPKQVMQHSWSCSVQSYIWYWSETASKSRLNAYYSSVIIITCQLRTTSDRHLLYSNDMLEELQVGQPSIICMKELVHSYLWWLKGNLELESLRN